MKGIPVDDLARLLKFAGKWELNNEIYCHGQAMSMFEDMFMIASNRGFTEFWIYENESKVIAFCGSPITGFFEGIAFNEHDDRATIIPGQMLVGICFHIEIQKEFPKNDWNRWEYKIETKCARVREKHG